MGPSVHHYHAVASYQQHPRMLQDPDPVVRHSVIQEDPVAVWFRSAYLPAAENNSIGGAHLEILRMHADLREGDIRLSTQFRG